MKSLNRREFLDTAKKTSVGLAAGVTILQSAKSVRAYTANEKVVLASVGLGGRGPHLAKGFLERDDCEIADDPGLDGNNNGVLDSCESPGDANLDGSVNIDDVVWVIVNWGQCPRGEPCPDLNGDGAVDIDDIIIVILFFD